MELDLPRNIDAEKAVLGSCLLDREAIIGVRNLVAVEDFSLERHALIYAVCLSCLEDKVPPDMITVADRLRDRDELELVGGMGYLAELSTAAPTSVHAPFYAQAVARAARQRRLIEQFAELSAAAYRGDPDKLLEEAGLRLELERRAAAFGDDWQGAMV